MSTISRHLHMGCGEALTGRWLEELGGRAGAGEGTGPWAGFARPRAQAGPRRGRGQRTGRRRER